MASTPAADVAAASGEAPAANGVAGHRKQMTRLLAIEIPTARVQAHMRKAIATPEAGVLKARAAAARAAAAAAGLPVDADPDLAEIKKQQKVLSASAIRIGGDAPVAMAAAADWISKALLDHAMGQTVGDSKKFTEISHLHAGVDLRKIVFVLVKNLPAFADYDAAVETKLKADRAAENRALKDKQKAEKAAAAAVAAGQPAPAAIAAAPAAAAAPVDDAEGNTTRFDTYIDNAARIAKGRPEFAAMRISARLREVISDIVAEFIRELTVMCAGLIGDTVHVRTLSADHIRAVISLLANYSHAHLEEKEAILAHVADVCERHAAHIVAEKEQKESRLTDDEKAARKAEAEKKEMAKKLAQSEKAIAKAKELAMLSKTLKAEVEKKAGPSAVAAK